MMVPFALTHYYFACLQTMSLKMTQSVQNKVIPPVEMLAYLQIYLVEAAGNFNPLCICNHPTLLMQVKICTVFSSWH